MLLPDLARSGDAALAADNILEALSRQMEVAGAALSVDATVGIACAPSHAQEADLLLQRAEAMYGPSGAHRAASSSSLDIEEEAPRRLILVTALKRAHRRARDHHALPAEGRARAPARDRGRGARALDRRGRRPGPPATFVPLAERTGLAEPLTELALETAAADCRRWQNDGHYTPVAVNVPARVLLDPAFPDLVESKRRTFGLEEGAPRSRSRRARRWATTSRRAGRSRACARSACVPRSTTSARLLSLSYLRELPVHALKIDRSFITHLLDEPDLEADRPLDHRAGAEPAARDGGRGVDERVCDRLVGLGCDYAQGFALARPMPADAMRSWLRARVTVD